MCKSVKLYVQEGPAATPAPTYTYVKYVISKKSHQKFKLHRIYSA
jgi:hypothetical protein